MVKNTNKQVCIPEILVWNDKKYHFKASKGNILCYIKAGDLDVSGDMLIIEYRDNKRYIDRFYVLFVISGYGLWKSLLFRRFMNMSTILKI